MPPPIGPSSELTHAGRPYELTLLVSTVLVYIVMLLQTVRVQSPSHGTRRIEAKSTLKIEEFFRKVCKRDVIVVITVRLV